MRRVIRGQATRTWVTLADALRAEQMRAAVVNRDLGQAKGILMERHRITADAAFAHEGQDPRGKRDAAGSAAAGSQDA